MCDGPLEHLAPSLQPATLHTAPPIRACLTPSACTDGSLMPACLATSSATALTDGRPTPCRPPLMQRPQHPPVPRLRHRAASWWVDGWAANFLPPSMPLVPTTVLCPSQRPLFACSHVRTAGPSLDTGAVTCTQDEVPPLLDDYEDSLPPPLAGTPTPGSPARGTSPRAPAAASASPPPCAAPATPEAEPARAAAGTPGGAPSYPLPAYRPLPPPPVPPGGSALLGGRPGPVVTSGPGQRHPAAAALRSDGQLQPGACPIDTPPSCGSRLQPRRPWCLRTR